jgi:hypothetical protein
MDFRDFARLNQWTKHEYRPVGGLRQVELQNQLLTALRAFEDWCFYAKAGSIINAASTNATIRQIKIRSKRDERVELEQINNNDFCPRCVVARRRGTVKCVVLEQFFAQL